MENRLATKIQLFAQRLASLAQSPDLEAELAILARSEHFQKIFANAIRTCLDQQNIQDIHLLWRATKNLDLAAARGIATVHMLADAGYTSDAKEILKTVDRTQVNGMQFRSRYAKTLLLTGDESEAAGMLTDLIQEDECGFGMVNGIVHELISSQRLELAQLVWNLMKDNPSKKGNIDKARQAIAKKFGKRPFEKGADSEVGHTVKQKDALDTPKATYDAEWLSAWKNLLADPNEKIVLCAMSIAHIAPTEWGEKLWELILKTDPSRVEIYYRYRTKLQNDDDIEIDHEVLVLDLAAISKILPTGDEPLKSSDFTTLKQFALLAGRHGNEVLESFERLTEILVRKNFLDCNQRDRLRGLMLRSVELFNTTHPAETPARFARSTSFKNLEESPPKTMRFQNEQTRRALTNTPDSEEVRKANPKRKRHP